MLVKQTKSQVIAHVRKYGSWNGLVCASKMYPVIGRTANELELVWNDQYGVCTKNGITYDEHMYPRPQSLDNWLNGWSFYNTSYEEGYYAAYYRIVK